MRRAGIPRTRCAGAGHPLPGATAALHCAPCRHGTQYVILISGKECALYVLCAVCVLWNLATRAGAAGDEGTGPRPDHLVGGGWMDSRRTPSQALTAREAARGTISQCLLDLGIVASRLADEPAAPLPQLARQLDVLADEVRQAGEWLAHAAGGEQE